MARSQIDLKRTRPQRAVSARRLWTDGLDSCGDDGTELIRLGLGLLHADGSARDCLLVDGGAVLDGEGHVLGRVSLEHDATAHLRLHRVQRGAEREQNLVLADHVSREVAVAGLQTAV